MGKLRPRGVKPLPLIVQKVAVTRFSPVSEIPKGDDTVVANNKAPEPDGTGNEIVHAPLTHADTHCLAGVLFSHGFQWGHDPLPHCLGLK